MTPPTPTPHRRRIRAAVAAGLLATVALAGCTASPPAANNTITCQGGSGSMAVSPGVVEQDGPNTYSLTSPSTVASCVDRTGTGITSARFTRFSILFPSIGCYVPLGTQGTGTGSVRWSDGTTSTADVVATLDSAYGGEVSITVRSGHFAGMTGSATFLAAPTTGSCFEDGITAESIEFGPMTLRRR